MFRIDKYQINESPESMKDALIEIVRFCDAKLEFFEVLIGAQENHKQNLERIRSMTHVERIGVTEAKPR